MFYAVAFNKWNKNSYFVFHSEPLVLIFMHALIWLGLSVTVIIAVHDTAARVFLSSLHAGIVARRGSRGEIERLCLL